MGKKKQKVDVSTTSFGGNLSNAFDKLNSLDTSSLPEGKDLPVNHSKTEKKTDLPKGRVVLRKETAHRGGKTVIVVSEFSDNISDQKINEIARSLRKQCGTGGTVKNREIEIQGTQPTAIRTYLEKKGFHVVGIG